MERRSRARGDATVAEIRAAVEQVLSDTAFQVAARQRADALDGKDGAALAASAIESLLAPSPAASTTNP